MRHSKHDIFPSHFSGLTKEESAKLEEDLLKHITQADGFESFEDMEKELLCPNCGGSHIVRRGYRGKTMTTDGISAVSAAKAFKSQTGQSSLTAATAPSAGSPLSTPCLTVKTYSTAPLPRKSPSRRPATGVSAFGTPQGSCRTPNPENAAERL